MATLGSPRDDEAEKKMTIAAYPPGEDFGYTAGALAIDQWFRLRLHNIRRQVPRREIPSAIAALRQTRKADLKALHEKCAVERGHAIKAARQAPQPPRRPDECATKHRADRLSRAAPQV